MVLNYIWIFFFGAAFIVALCKLIFMGDTEVFSAIVKATFDMSKTGFEISLGLTGVLTLWMGPGPRRPDRPSERPARLF